MTISVIYVTEVKVKSNVIKYLILVFIFVLLVVPGCKKKSGPVVKDIALLKLIPEDASALFCINVKRLTVLEYYKEMIADFKNKMIEPSKEKIFDSYEDFIDKTGIDIEKDIRTLSIALFSGGIPDTRDKTTDNVLMLIDLDYKKDKILKFLKSKKSGKTIDYTEESYNSINIIKMKNGSIPLFADKAIENPAFSFINNRTIAVGKAGRIKQVIDLANSKGKSILLCVEMESYLNTPENISMASFAFVVPENLKKKVEEGLYAYDLTKAEIVSGNIDQLNRVWLGEIKLAMKNEQANAQLASVIAFAKTVASATFGAEFSEMIGNIQINSSEAGIKLTFSIQHDLLKKLFKKIDAASIGLPDFTGEK